MIQSFQQRVAPRLEFICRFDLSGSHLYLLLNKTTPSDVESREEQDGNKQKFVGGTMAKLWHDLRQDVAKSWKRNEK